MKNLLENCERHFHTDNLYEVLGVKIDASKQEIKKGYHKKSLIFHPDRDTQDKAEATIKFQILGQVYNILSDDARRAEYDETGAVDEASVEQDRNWEQYWRLLFPKITLKDIEEFAVKYRGSDEETEDLKAIYLSSQGDMDTIMSNMMYSTFEDEDRYSTLLKKLIKGGQLPDYKAFSKESKKKKEKRSKKAQHEAEEAEKEAKKLKLDESEDSLIAAIRSKSRLQQSESFLSQLEAKYSKTTSDKLGSKSAAKSGNKSMKGAKRKKKI